MGPNTRPTVSIVLADPQELARRGLRNLVYESARMIVRGETHSAEQAPRLVQDLQPDVLIIDAAGQDQDWLEAIRTTRASAPATEILVFSAVYSESFIRSVIAAGARGLVLKSEPEDVVLAALDAVSRHEPYFSAAISDTIMKAFARSIGLRHGEFVDFGLSARESMVLAMIAEGKNNRAVASVLGISVRTVETHRTSIMRKLGVTSVAELIRYAVRNRIIDP